jgi:hypothetical protein
MNIFEIRPSRIVLSQTWSQNQSLTTAVRLSAGNDHTPLLGAPPTRQDERKANSRAERERERERESEKAAAGTGRDAAEMADSVGGRAQSHMDRALLEGEVDARRSRFGPICLAPYHFHRLLLL